MSQAANVRRALRARTPSTLLALALTLTMLLGAPGAHADRVVLLVDNSGSMRGNDAERLVPEAVLGFVAGLPPRTEVGIVAFDASARLISPLGEPGSLDPRVLDRLDYRGQLTDPAAAVERALYEFREQPSRYGGRDALVLITDGVVDLGSTAASLRAEDWLLGELRGSLVERGIGVWAIALTEAADFRLLSRLTEATGGRYFRALVARDVEAAIGRIDRGIREANAAVAAEAPAPASSATGPATGPAPTTVTAPRPAPIVDRQPEPRVEAPSPTVVASDPTPAAPTGQAAPALSPRVSVTPGTDGAPAAKDPGRRWWLSFGLMAVGVTLLGWVILTTWRDRTRSDTAEEPALEYFPDCYLVDLHGVTDRPTHRLASKYNMITRLQNPPEDGINYIQVFRRQIGRRHALIEYRDFSFWVIDQNSLNGTFLNGERLKAETRLKHGDRLRFHIYEFEFCVSDLALSNETLVEQERAASR